MTRNLNQFGEWNVGKVGVDVENPKRALNDWASFELNELEIILDDDRSNFVRLSISSNMTATDKFVPQVMLRDLEPMLIIGRIQVIARKTIVSLNVERKTRSDIRQWP